MNKVLAERAMRKLGQCSYEQLKVAEQELLDELYSSDFSPEVCQKVYSFNFCVVLAAQSKSITFEEYRMLIGDLAGLFAI